MSPATLERPAEARPAPSPLMTADEVAKMLNVSKQRVWELSRKGGIPTIRLGANTCRYRQAAVLEWIVGKES